MKVITIVAIALALFAVAARPGPNPLVGSWKLVSYEDKDANNNLFSPTAKPLQAY